MSRRRYIILRLPHDDLEKVTFLKEVYALSNREAAEAICKGAPYPDSDYLIVQDDGQFGSVTRWRYIEPREGSWEPVL